jgi:hypothetical protein
VASNGAWPEPIKRSVRSVALHFLKENAWETFNAGLKEVLKGI